MGKNKKGAKKQVLPPQVVNEVALGTEDLPEEEPVEEIVQMTPKEKADSYKQVQLEVLMKFVKDFEEEERALRDQPERLFMDKLKDQEKREKEETKRIDKVFKKETGEVEELHHNATNATVCKALRDRIAKTIAEI